MLLGRYRQVYPGPKGGAGSWQRVTRCEHKMVPRILMRRFCLHSEALSGGQQPPGAWQGGLPPRLAETTHRAGSVVQLLRSHADSAGCGDGAAAAAHVPSKASRVRPSVKLVSRTEPAIGHLECLARFFNCSFVEQNNVKGGASTMRQHNLSWEDCAGLQHAAAAFMSTPHPS